MSTKKSFTLIEILIVLFISSLIGMYIFKQIQHNNFLKDVVKLQNTIKFIINDGLISVHGYASARGEDCSSNYDFKDLSTKRFYDCNDYANRFTLNNNFITGDGLMQNNGTCKIYLSENTKSRRSFNIYVDCSNVKEYMGKKEVSQVEDALNFTFSNELRDINTNIIRKVNTYNTLITPSENDGIIQATFEL